MIPSEFMKKQELVHLLCDQKSENEDDESIEKVRQVYGNHCPHASRNGPVPANTYKFFDAENGIKKRNDKDKQIKGDGGNYRTIMTR